MCELNRPKSTKHLNIFGSVLFLIICLRFGHVTVTARVIVIFLHRWNAELTSCRVLGDATTENAISQTWDVVNAYSTLCFPLTVRIHRAVNLNSKTQSILCLPVKQKSCTISSDVLPAETGIKPTTYSSVSNHWSIQPLIHTYPWWLHHLQPQGCQIPELKTDVPERLMI